MWVAKWKGAVIAKSDACIEIENNQYFPPGDVNEGFLKPSSMTSVCPWKGVASYYDVVVGDDVDRDAAWSYKEPKPDAEQIKGYIAFWKGVIVERG